MDQIKLENLGNKLRLSARDLRDIWDAASQYDDTLKMRPGMLETLLEKRVCPISFSRTKLFTRMARCESSLFWKVPIKPRKCQQGFPLSALMAELRSGFSETARARVRNQDSFEFLSIARVLDRWMSAKPVLVTDLHYIGTRFDTRIDTSALNDFNLLPRGTDGYQSQDSLVISSVGAVSDSHSDDHSGSNHSFVGAKLWLLWDTLDGLQHGLEDWERCLIGSRAAFDLSTFLALPSSRWILIAPGQTMFIPARLSHKVITLTPYLGLGSFHAGLPGFVDLLKRWDLLFPLWASKSRREKRRTVEFITRRAIRRVHSLRVAHRKERLHWGVPYLQWRLRQPDLHGTDMDTPAISDNLKEFIRAAARL